MHKKLIDDGFRADLVETAFFDGNLEIPVIKKPDKIIIPDGMVPFSKRKADKEHKNFVCFYEHDLMFRDCLTATDKYLDELSKFPGIISPDCSLYIDMPLCLQIVNVYMNRAVGHYLQSKGDAVVFDKPPVFCYHILQDYRRRYEEIIMKKRTSKQIFAETFLDLSRELPVDKITVKKIVEESGLSLKTFYNHFPDKYSLMLYIEQVESDRLHEKLAEGDMTFRDYLRAGVEYYRKIRHFLSNAFENTQGADSFVKTHAEESCRSLHGLILKKNGLTEIPADILFAERLYANGLVSSFYDYNFGKSDLTEEEFIRYCEECIPEKLRPYLL